jgi:hypothetical protein
LLQQGNLSNCPLYAVTYFPVLWEKFNKILLPVTGFYSGHHSRLFTIPGGVLTFHGWLGAFPNGLFVYPGRLPFFLGRLYMFPGSLYVYIDRVSAYLGGMVTLPYRELFFFIKPSGVSLLFFLQFT